MASDSSLQNIFRFAQDLAYSFEYPWTVAQERGGPRVMPTTRPEIASDYVGAPLDPYVVFDSKIDPVNPPRLPVDGNLYPFMKFVMNTMVGSVNVRRPNAPPSMFQQVGAGEELKLGEKYLSLSPPILFTPIKDSTSPYSPLTAWNVLWGTTTWTDQPHHVVKFTVYRPDVGSVVDSSRQRGMLYKVVNPGGRRGRMSTQTLMQQALTQIGLGEEAARVMSDFAPLPSAPSSGMLGGARAKRSRKQLRRSLRRIRKSVRKSMRQVRKSVRKSVRRSLRKSMRRARRR